MKKMIFQLLISFVLLNFINLNLAFPSLKKANRVPTLMISMDGFRADKLDSFLFDNPNSAFQKEFVELGVKSEYMLPSFPSLTFPNHFTLVTGK